MSAALRSGWASAIVIGCITGIALTSDWLPDPVASHFAAGGGANGFVSRPVYVWLAIAFTLLLPVLTAFGLPFAARRFPRLLSLPNRDYWLAAERREQTVELLAVRSEWLAAAGALFAFCVHLLVIRANYVTPPHFDVFPLLAVTAAFAVGVATWLVALRQHFERCGDRG